MKIALWALSFVFLAVSAAIGIGASIGVLPVEWFTVCLLCIAGIFSAAGYADRYDA